MLKNSLTCMQPAVMHAFVSMFLVVYIAQTLYLHSGLLPLETCTGGLVSNSTYTYTACTDCNLHCDVVHGGGSGVMEVVPWNGSMWWAIYYNIWARKIIGVW